MCGIVGATANRPIVNILLEGLRRLEYRGYDSAGVAVCGDELTFSKAEGKVQVLADQVASADLRGGSGIAHTRWATHGKPSVANAHPHRSGDLALVHNGIIENHNELRDQLSAAGYTFVSETDSEVIVHLVHHLMKTEQNLIAAVKAAVPQLEGAYGLAVINHQDPSRIVCARSGSPLVVGLGMGENFIASDQLALRQVTDRFLYLEEGDIAEVSNNAYQLWDENGNPVDREVIRATSDSGVADRAGYRHFMLKEIYEQPKVVKNTLASRLSKTKVLGESFGAGALQALEQTKAIQIVACGTSYHAGMVAKYWLEGLAGVPCQVEIASEYRYRKTVVAENSLLVTISQSGETADTLAALRQSKEQGFLASLAVCNVAQSSLVRESDFVVMTEAGVEIGVASTKAFTTQLAALLTITVVLARAKGLAEEEEAKLVQAMKDLPDLVEACLALDTPIKAVAEQFIDKDHALFLGRGSQWPIAMEGALKLKEISYIHAESYAAGELKHGPLALVDENMPVVAVAPNDELLEKLKSNLHEVAARGGKLFVFAEQGTGFAGEDNVEVVEMPPAHEIIAPIAYTIPLQLLSYHVAVLKGTDVDQPRNLAKSVTVE